MVASLEAEAVHRVSGWKKFEITRYETIIPAGMQLFGVSGCFCCPMFRCGSLLIEVGVDFCCSLRADLGRLTRLQHERGSQQMAVHPCRR
jgi:hypothetical protein